jgi:polyhydroxybutyrate depolymerase
MSCGSIVVVLALVACSSAAQPVDEPTGDASEPRDPVPDSSSAACSGKATQPIDATWTVDGRDVEVRVPASYDPTARTPIVVNLHGLSSDGSDQARITRMIESSDAHGFIAVHPNGTGSPRGWNGGDCCNPAASSNVDDTTFISKLLDEVESKLCADADRIFVIGMSNGAFLANRLGCELSDRIAAIGAVSGVLGIDSCSPSRPMPVFQVHGTSDFIIPFGGGGVNGNISVEDSIDGWAARNHCTGAPVTTYDEGDATCVRRGGCDGNADVVLCTIDGGGHQWPSGESTGIFNGTLSDDLDTTEVAWDFFAAHPRKLNR